jgi:SNF2 family DNA or RNA helicase
MPFAHRSPCHRSMALYAHQERAVDFILKQQGQAAIFADIGTGKTLIALTAFQKLRNKLLCLKMLVICPISLIEPAWGEDIRKFTNLKYCNLRKEFNPQADIFLLNYESVITKSGLERIQKVINLGSVMIALDESSKTKNHLAKVTRVLLKIKPLFPCRIIMSGSPAPNDETEYWSQISFVKDGIFQPSFYAFRNAYFYLARGKQIIGNVYSKEVARRLFSQGFKYKLSPQGVKALATRMAPICFKARKEDCLDLPDQVDEIRSVDMGPHQLKAYTEMKNYLVAEIKNQQIAAPIALTKLMKLRQICSGFAMNSSGEALEIGENPKLKELREVLEETGNEQIIIWATFQHEIRTICKALGEQAVALYGETTDKDTVISDFKSGKTKYLVAHPRSAGHGLTFVNSHIQIFYSLDYSWES